jgi:hypothetical protein
MRWRVQPHPAGSTLRLGHWHSPQPVRQGSMGLLPDCESHAGCQARLLGAARPVYPTAVWPQGAAAPCVQCALQRLACLQAHRQSYAIQAASTRRTPSAACACERAQGRAGVWVHSGSYCHAERCHGATMVPETTHMNSPLPPQNTHTHTHTHTHTQTNSHPVACLHKPARRQAVVQPPL